MQCYKAIWVRRQQQAVPCGQCMACRINKGRVWSARIQLENLEHFHNYARLGEFLTFTYNDENLPAAVDPQDAPLGTLQKKVFLKWVDNENSAGAVPHFRYYAIGEYGDRFYRPHYHMAVFPFNGEAIHRLRASWSRFGFTSASQLTDARARYLANYTGKKLTKADDSRLGSHQEPEFRTSSRNPPLGYDFAQSLTRHYQKSRYAELLKKRGDIERSFRFNGAVYPLSQYVLNTTRRNLGIPLLHRDRVLANPDYNKIFAIEDTPSCLKTHHAQTVSINGKINSKTHRTPHAKL